jgi:hypothetical protein
MSLPFSWCVECFMILKCNNKSRFENLNDMLEMANHAETPKYMILLLKSTLSTLDIEVYV